VHVLLRVSLHTLNIMTPSSHAAPLDAFTPNPCDALHLCSACMINPGPDVDLFWCHGWRNGGDVGTEAGAPASGAPASAHESDMAGTFDAATCTPCVDHTCKEQARAPCWDAFETTHIGRVHKSSSHPSSPCHLQAIQRVDGDLPAKHVASDDGSKAGMCTSEPATAHALTTTKSILKRKKRSPSSRGLNGKRHPLGFKPHTPPPRGRRLREFRRIITNQTRLRLLYIPQDMYRRLVLIDMFPKLCDNRRASVCTVDLMMASGESCPVTMMKMRSNGHAHRRFTMGWREFCKVAGVEVGDELGFTRGDGSVLHVAKRCPSRSVK